MKRNIVNIDEEKCTGCGLCISACHEGALELVDGKARLVSEAYCDGLGACLPECPAGAITIEEREAPAFDEKAVAERSHKGHNEPDVDARCGCGGGEAHKPAAEAECGCGAGDEPEPLACGCPGSHSRTIGRSGGTAESASQGQPVHAPVKSQLRQWPVQMKLVPPRAPYFDNAHLLVAADCTAYAYAAVHQDFMRNKVTLIGCPKLDDADYGEKLAHILASHSIKSITVLRMEVPCCGGLVSMVKHALVSSGKMIPWRVVVISAEGEILEE
ncbi:MAG: 4Fe-4S binding protein [Bacillota bacterium]|nr:4Fe-4S binding protein [Bacillota bacterium]